MLRQLHALLHREDGQDLVEYALLSGFIAMASIAALAALGPVISNFYGSIIPYFDGV